MSGLGGWMEGLSPLINNLSDRFGSGAALRGQLAREQQYQDAWHAQNIPAMEIRSRVDGAKAMGLHPLTAMGVNLGSYSSPIPYSPTDTSRAMGSYNRSREQAKNAEVQNAQIEEIKANTRRANADADITELQAHDARARLATQPGQPPVVVDPSRVIAHGDRRSVEAAPPAPTFKKFRLGGDKFGVNMELPAQGSSPAIFEDSIVANAIASALHGSMTAAENFWYGPAKKPSVKIPSNTHWEWSKARQVWTLERNERR